MQYLLDEYCDQLTAIGKVHTLSKNKDTPVSEAELVSGTLMANWSDHQRRREMVDAMNLQVSTIFDWLFLNIVSYRLDARTRASCAG